MPWSTSLGRSAGGTPWNNFCSYDLKTPIADSNQKPGNLPFPALEQGPARSRSPADPIRLSIKAAIQHPLYVTQRHQEDTPMKRPRGPESYRLTPKSATTLPKHATNYKTSVLNTKTAHDQEQTQRNTITTKRADKSQSWAPNTLINSKAS